MSLVRCMSKMSFTIILCSCSSSSWLDFSGALPLLYYARLARADRSAEALRALLSIRLLAQQLQSLAQQLDENDLAMVLAHWVSPEWCSPRIEVVETWLRSISSSLFFMLFHFMSFLFIAFDEKWREMNALESFGAQDLRPVPSELLAMTELAVLDVVLLGAQQFLWSLCSKVCPNARWTGWRRVL